ncbi:DMAP1-binding Domain [Popillia japonica]|uniref:DMAP1-binding Domain n=1 Tax=Popillia japonica TaxID=7064 RepID=A0AAW1IFT5_POPJA
MENLEDVADRAEAERQQSLRDLEQLYEWLQQFEDPPPAPRPPPPQQFRNGDITQKGYEKKRTRLLSPYVPKQNATGNSGNEEGNDNGNGVHGPKQHTRRRTQRRVTHNEKRYHSDVGVSGVTGENRGVSPASRAMRRGNRRLTRNESRYHSEVRQEAVQQALAQAMQNRHKLPMPSKRTSVMARSPDRDRHDSESSSDEDSIVNEETVESTPEREKARDRSTPQREGQRSEYASDATTTTTIGY